MNSGTSSKRQIGGNGGPSSGNKRPKICCQFGEKCYRRNPLHFTEYSHPHLEKLYSLQKDGEDLRIPADFKAKIDCDIILSQLQIYRDQGFAAAAVPKEDKEQNQTNKNVEKVKKEVPTVETKKQVTPRVDKQKETVIPKLNMATVRAKNDDKKIVEMQGNNSHSTSSKNIETQRSNSHSTKLGNGASIASGSKGTDEKPGRRGFAWRLDAASPYNFFLTAVRDSLPTHKEILSIRFHELLDPSLGDLVASLQINFMVEMDWLMEQYKVYGHEKKPLFILYGEGDEILQNPKSLPENIAAKKIKPSAFGHHHTKMSLFYYKDNSIRVVVSTANLIASDWYNRTQGVWVSPSCPQLPLDSDTRAGESPTEFKADLLRYMSSYHLPALQEWMSRLRRTDFSAIKVFFVASTPGSHRGVDSDKFGHRRLAQLLKKHCTIPSLLSPAGGRESWPVVAQCSSIGTLGSDPDSWMCGELRTSMSQRMMRPGDMPQPPPPFRVIYPSLKNVKDSHDDLLGGACLPYSRKTHEKQLWFRKFLYEWKSDKRHRSQAIPHIKTYTRVSPCGRHLAWFHLTSANLSKAAWGKVQESKGKSSGPGLYIMSYEAGVLFLPKLLINKEVFSLEEGGTADSKPFPLPWDYPLSPYGEDDLPFVNEYLY